MRSVSVEFSATAEWTTSVPDTGRGRVDFHYLSDFLAGDGMSAGVCCMEILDVTSAMKSFGLFVQDDFRATRRLTLNLGLRYDVTRPIKDSHNRLANYVPSQGVVQVGYGISEPYKTNWTNFSPRIGAAFDVFGTGKTILRAGFGIIYVQPSIRTFAFNGGGLNLNPSALIPGGTGRLRPSLSIPASDNMTDLIDWEYEPRPRGVIFPVNNPTLASCTADSPCNFFGVDQKLKTPYVLNWNVNLQQEIRPGTLMQIAYVANAGRNLYSTLDLNQPNQALSTQCVAAGGGYDGA